MKWKTLHRKVAVLFLLGGLSAFCSAAAFGQSVLFDFDNAPLHSPFPIDLTAGGINAHFSASPTYYNYSIQRADVLGFTPVGFAGNCIYPNQVYACDLLISFNPALSDISIMYAPEEYATDSSCTMRITAYLGTTVVGTNTYSIPEPGTWPTGTLSFSSAQPFDNVVIHYAAPPVTGGDYGPIFMADNLMVTVAAIPTPTPTPTPAGVSISGTVVYCANPSLNPVPGVTLTITGSGSGTTVSDGSGGYTFTALASGGNYTVTPAKVALTPASAGINTVDVIATQRHFLNLGTPLSGCRLTAADVNGDTSVNTVDVIASQRFFLGLSTGIANTGKYQFTPLSRSYLGLVTDQTGQNYETLVFGDTATSFVHRPEGLSQAVAGDGTSVSAFSGLNPGAGEVPATVAALSLPNVAIDAFVTNFILQVTTTVIDAKERLVGFQGDFTFDERVVAFQSPPVRKAGITSGNWNVSGNVLDGQGPIRTLRVSAFSNDFTPLSGLGTLFELRMTRVGKGAQGTPLLWAAPPNQFIFIDADLRTQKPGSAAPGRVTAPGKRR